jgi:hypothetical protein
MVRYYLIVTIKVAVANSIGAVKTAATLKKRTDGDEGSRLAVVVDKSHNRHFPAIEIKQ